MKEGISYFLSSPLSFHTTNVGSENKQGGANLHLSLVLWRICNGIEMQLFFLQDVDSSTGEPILDFFNNVQIDELSALEGCSKKTAEILTKMRPFTSWDDLVILNKMHECVGKGKRLVGQLLNFWCCIEQSLFDFRRRSFTRRSW